MRLPSVATLVVVAFGAAAAGCASTAMARPEAFPRSGGDIGPSARVRLPSSTSGLLDTARLQRGVRYQLGGASPSEGFDCSGLVRYVFLQHGVNVPRTAAEQYRTGIDVKAANIVRGDLVFFSTTGPGPTHVGIVVDSGTFVHAPDTGAVVRQERFDTPYWTSRYLGARRLVTLDTLE